jgi:hypothetical protein
MALDDLLEITPGEYASVSVPVNTDCSSYGASCFDPARNFFGRCAAGACQPYCITAWVRIRLRRSSGSVHSSNRTCCYVAA